MQPTVKTLTQHLDLLLELFMYLYQIATLWLLAVYSVGLLQKLFRTDEFCKRIVLYFHVAFVQLLACSCNRK